MKHAIGWALWVIVGGCGSSAAGPGESCACASDCGEGLYCTPEADPPLDLGSSCNGQAVGTCQPFRGQGEVCDVVADLRCGLGLTCNRATSPSTCIAQHAPAGEPCWTAADCAEGLGCNRGLEPPSCSSPVAADEPCAEDLDCADALRCIEDRCGPPAPESASCAEDADCAAELWCRQAGCTSLACGGALCAARGTGGPREPCRLDEQCASARCVLVAEDGYQTLRCE